MKIICHECGASCSNDVPSSTVIRGYIMCGECVERVSERTWAAFVHEAHRKDGSPRFIETPDEEFAAYGSDKSVAITEQKPLTPEMIEEAAQLNRLQQKGIDTLAGPPPYSAPFTGPPSGPDDSDREPTVEQELKELAKTQRTHHGKLTPITSKQLFADEIDALTPADRAEYRKFERYLKCRAKYGMKVLVGRPYWRKYFGLE
jgi:hypothetical protein